jgi:hypothetical protein
MIPPNFALEPDVPETRAIVAAVRQALDAASPPKAVCLSSIIRPCVASSCVDRVQAAELSRDNLTPFMMPVNSYSYPSIVLFMVQWSAIDPPCGWRLKGAFHALPEEHSRR